MVEQEEGGVESLQRKLYRRNATSEIKPRNELHEVEHEEAPDEWKVEDDVSAVGAVLASKQDMSQDEYLKEEALRRKNAKVGSRVIRGIFIASFAFFVLALGLAVYFIFGGKNQVSCDNVGIVITGPRSVASGKKLILDIAIENSNPVPLRDVGLEMRFPEGTRNADESSISMTTTREQVGTIEVAERVRTTTSALLFGQEQTESEIQAIVSYGIDESDASFSCEQTYRILIATAPVSLMVDGLEEISSGQQVEFTVLVTSNSEEVVPDMRVVAEYPYGFEFVSSSPEPTTENNVWELGDVSPDIEHTLKVRGIVRGQGTEARTVNFSIGERDPVNPEGLKNIIQKVNHPLLVTNPFLELEATLNESSNPQTSAVLGDIVQGTLHWKNTLPSALHDVQVSMVLNGSMLDPSSVESGSGFFRSVDNTLIWTPQTYETFDLLEPGEEGEIQFRFQTRPFIEGTSVANPVMHIEFSVQARRIADNIPVSQNLVGQSKRTIRFDTNVLFDTYALYNSNPFTNTGPHPPRVNVNTTYTVAWSLKNGINDIQSGVVRGELPVNIEWVGRTSPANESVTFNPVSREVTWAVGDLPRGTGYQSPERIVYFQVSTTPSISQVGSELTLVSDSSFQGVDGFTKDVIEKKKPITNTNLKNDPYFKSVWGVVIE